MQALQRVRLAGFRSIRDTEPGLDLRPVNVLIGANGTGKTNLIAFFRLLNYLTTESLARWTAEHGGGAAQLYYGPKVSPRFEAALSYSDGERTSTYSAEWVRVAPDALVLASETLEYHQLGHDAPMRVPLAGGDTESALPELARGGGTSAKVTTARVLRALLDRTKVFHFHDTSDTARVKQVWRLADNGYLKSDGANLAPVLHRLYDENPAHYQRLVAVIRQVVPFFGDFVLEPTGAGPDPRILLQWRERGSDLVFGPHQLSDGTLRFMLLATLLLAPEEQHRRVVIIDEPELGLHPAAIDALGNLVYTASTWTQVLLTTQSSALLDVFDAEDVVVVSRLPEGRSGRYETQFRRLDPDQLSAWENCSLGDMWEQNLIGGRPMA